MINEKRLNRGENPDPKTPPPPPPGSDRDWGGFTPLPGPKYATCIEVFQNGNKVMSFSDAAMEIVAENKECIIFYDKYNRRTTIYNNGGIIFVRYREDKE